MKRAVFVMSTAAATLVVTCAAAIAQSGAPGATGPSNASTSAVPARDANRSAGASKGDAVTTNPSTSSSDMGGKWKSGANASSAASGASNGSSDSGMASHATKDKRV